MTTAARPTFEPARGGQGRNEKDLSAISRQYSSRDLPGHTKLKYRDHGQGTAEENRSKDFRKELEEREREVKGSRRPPEPKRPRVEQVPAISLDADDPLEEEESDSDESDDDTEALLAELNKIKKERAMEQAKKVILSKFIFSVTNIT